LPARGSSFPKTEGLLLLILLFPLFAAGCQPREVWGIPAEALKADLAAGRYASLDAVGFPARDPADCLSLGPGAAYYLSEVFDSLGKKAQAAALRDLSWARDPSPWREEAGLAIVQDGIAEKAYGRAAGAARSVMGSAPTGEARQRALRGLVQALYWGREDAAALEEAGRLERTDPEVLLIRAVSSLRLGLPAGHDLVMQLFVSQRTAAQHGRAAAFIDDSPDLAARFSGPERGLIEGKAAFVQGAWARGIPLVEAALDGLDPVLLQDGVLVTDLAAAYQYAGRLDTGAAALERLAARLSGQARTDALEGAGKLYRRARQYPRALEALRAAAREAASDEQRDRLRWFVMDVLFSQDPAAAARQAGAEAAAWTDPQYFTDLLQSRIADCVAARRWGAIADLWTGLASVGPASVRAQLSYILARAWQEGIVRRLPGDPPAAARDLFRDAADRDPNGYYGILAASMLGETPARAVPAVAAQRQEGQAVLDPLAMGGLDFGLSEMAWDRLWPGRDGMSEAQLLEASRRFAAAGDWRSSMYFTGVVARRRKLSLSELQGYYPRGYAALIEPLARDAGVPLPVLYGLVREESYFDAEAVSHAGAVGLSQLMPATAADVARSLRIKNPDLKDPATNLAIGTRHLKNLLSRTSSVPQALLAYNAGLNRVRQWRRAYPGLPDDLLVEAVPIEETRGYVRKILVSTVMYAFLWQEADPREAALSFHGLEAGARAPGPTPPGAIAPR
jgi:hypothetical protein